MESHSKKLPEKNNKSGSNNSTDEMSVAEKKSNTTSESTDKTNTSDREAIEEIANIIKSKQEENSPTSTNSQDELPPVTKYSENLKKTQENAITLEQATGKFTHSTFLTRKVAESTDNASKQKYLDDWYLKSYVTEIPDELSEQDINHPENLSTELMKVFLEFLAEVNEKRGVAEREVLGQEIFRLFINDQPKTRLVYESENEIGVMSKGVKNAISLEEMVLRKKPTKRKAATDDVKQALHDGTFYGLGELMVIALLVNEVDFKLGNIVVNENNRCIKLDGDWCFADYRFSNIEKQGSYVNHIKPETLDMLPYPGAHHAMNWLDIQVRGKLILMPQLFDAKSPFNRILRAEINRALLKVILMPPELLQTFVDHYISSSNNREIYEYLLSRKQQLYQVAIQNISFATYIDSKLGSFRRAELDAKEFIQSLLKFQLSKKAYLLSMHYGSKNVDKFDEKNKSKLEAEINSLFQNLINDIKHNLPSPVNLLLKEESHYPPNIFAEKKGESKENQGRDNNPHPDFGRRQSNDH